MRFILLISIFASITNAATNVTAVYIENGKYLSVKLVDDPGNPPFLAGKFWSSLKGDNSLKKFATKDIGIKCDGTKANSSEDFFATCKIIVRSELLIPVTDSSIGFLMKGTDAKDLLAGFVKPLNSELLLGYNKMQLNMNFQHITYTFIIEKDLITD